MVINLREKKSLKKKIILKENLLEIKGTLKQIGTHTIEEYFIRTVIKCSVTVPAYSSVKKITNEQLLAKKKE